MINLGEKSMALLKLLLRLVRKLGTQLPSVIAVLGVLYGAPLIDKLPFFHKPPLVQNRTTETGSVIGVSEDKSKCVLISSQDENWDKKRYSQKDGYWTPKSGFVDPVMWYKLGINPNIDKKISIEYSIKKLSKTASQPSSLIVEYGKRQGDKDVLSIFKTWVPEGENDQIWRFSRNEDFSQEKLTPDIATDLTDPAKLEQTDVMIIQPVVLSDNEATFNFTYQYTSRENKKVIPDSLAKTVTMPTSRLSESEEVFMLGIGTYVGHGIKFEKIEVCQ
jgi:hypothetical protein